MPNFSGVWNLKDQVQAIAAGRWTGIPTFELYVWGFNTNGALGDDTVVSKSSPVQIGALTNWSQVAAGGRHTASIKTDGTLWTWGRNSNGQLGTGTVVYRSSPVQIGALTNWYEVSAGRYHTASIKTDGTMWTWGLNSNGQLGDGTVVNRSSPVQIGALTTWYEVAAGSVHTASIKTDGTMWTWGRNGSGQLGDDTVVNRSSPVQIGALTNWSQVSAGGGNIIAFTASVKTDGTLWAWGANGSGQLGDGTIINRSSPVQVGALTNWSQVSAGGYHTASIKTDGTLWAWGANTNGQLGGGNVFNRSSPVQIGALTNWSQVAASRGNISSSNNHTASIKTDGTLWTWGRNSSGQLGDGTVVNRSSPVQIGALTTWYEVSAGAYHTLAIYQGSTN